MSYRVERLPDEPILILTAGAEFSIKNDVLASAEEATGLMAEIPEGPIYYVLDTHGLRINFSDLVSGLWQATRATNLLKEPRLQLVAVGSGTLIEMGIKSLSQAQYGGLSVPLFETIDEALTYIRQEISGQS